MRSRKLALSEAEGDPSHFGTAMNLSGNSQVLQILRSGVSSVKIRGQQLTPRNT